MRISDWSSDVCSSDLFFAGSGTTGHAVMELNKDTGGNRRFILAQMPEPVDGNKKFPTIFEVTKARIKAAGERIKAANPMFAGDVGFRVLKLASTNISEWDRSEEHTSKLQSLIRISHAV